MRVFLFEGFCGLSTTKQLTIEERKAEVLIKLRKYKLIEKQPYEGAFAYIIDIPQDKRESHRLVHTWRSNSRHRSHEHPL